MLDKWNGQYISKFAFLRKYEDPKPLVVAGSSSSSSSSSSSGGGSRAASYDHDDDRASAGKESSKDVPEKRVGGR